MTTIKIAIVGDIMIGRLFNDRFAKDPSFNPWTNTQQILQGADLTIGNLETTITNNTTEWPNKSFTYKLEPKYAHVLRDAGFNFLGLANNHIFDYREAGMNETISTLNTLGIKYSGAGSNITEAKKPSIFIIKGVKIAVLSLADHYDSWKATDTESGIWYVNIKEKYWSHVFDMVKKVKCVADIIILSIHHGSNWVNQVPSITKEFFHELIDHGVDVVVGHSSHHILPVEEYNNGFIFYSLGDFIDDYAIDKNYRNDLGMIAQIIIKNKKIDKANIIPTKINSMQVFVAKPRDQKWITDELQL
jgi:poly-gamma-glutamate capsule biosynthesis protein CapA/YwtB (metallophosphatase superfamily)